MNHTNSANKEARLLRLALTTALASAALAGCATSAAPPAAVSAGKAEAAMAKGKQGTAVSHAEAAVLADPRNPQYRATLGAAYLEAGRYASAAASFDDALKLGDTSGRTALSLSLALSAQGKLQDAQRVLKAWENAIAPSDYGLALALAGNPDHGAKVLANEIRNGANTAKVRQNLAYAYALNGQWREARLMASQDLTGDKVNDRIGEWAIDTSPDNFQGRVAKLLGTPANVKDPGQPVHLALGNFPETAQLAAVADPALAAAPAPATYELPPLGDPIDPSVGIARHDTPPSTAKPAAAPAPKPAAKPAAPAAAQAAAKPASKDVFEAAFKPQAPAGAAVRAPAATDTARFVQATATKPTSAPAARTVPASAASGTHLVQLGAFSSEASAKRAWGIYVQRYPELAKHEMVITQAVVKGKNYWRVAAGGYSATASKAMCGKINGNAGQGCIAYAQGRPLPGGVDKSRQLASR